VVLSEHIKSILGAAKDKLTIVEIIFKDVWPSGWSGSLADILEARSKAFAELVEYPNPEVRTLARAKLAILEKSIRKEREREAEEHNEREQRFE
jgi:hypothetical protein